MNHLKGGVRIRLALDETLVDLPWEYVLRPDRRHDNAMSSFLLLDPRISLVRQQASEHLTRSLAKTRKQIDELQAQLEITREMVGRSGSLEKVRKAIGRAAPTTATVLIRGESGVGKEFAELTPYIFPCRIA